MEKAQLLYRAENKLGEGPFTLDGAAIFWFDIFGSSAFRLDIAVAGVQKTELDHFLCCAGAVAGSGIVAAGQNGLELLDENFQVVRLICPPPFDTEILRFNDGKVGPDGAFWAGSMSYTGDKAIGGLYRFGGEVSQILSGMVIPNGLGWSPDGRVMYVTDSGKGAITRWDFDPESGSIVNEQFFVRIPPEEGVPDGLSVDEDGNVWSARWGGSRVVGFDPEGKVIAEIEVPAGNPTSCCFGGPDNRTLFITSARHGLSDPGRTDGALFTASTGTRGQVPYQFRFV